MNALLTNNLMFLPVRVSHSRGTIVRPGLAVSMLAGFTVAFAALRLIAGACAESAAPGANLVTAGPAAACLGALAANWLSNLADTRLLRTAACRAAGAPAAHPDTVAAMETAPPHAILDVTARMLQQPRRPSSV